MLVLVGANGFLGRHVCQLLDRRGELATAVATNPDKTFFERFAPSVRVINTAEFDSPAGRDVIANATAIVYLRWCSVPATFLGEPWRELPDNVVPAMRFFLRVAESSPRARIVFLSSGGTVYGPGAEPHSELSATRPISSHGLGKLMGEEALAFVARRYGNPYAILRVSNAVGRWQSNEAQGIVSVALRRARNGVPVRLFGGGTQVRDFVDADDVAQAIYLACADTEHTAVTWNVGSGRGISIAELLERMSAIIGRDISVEHVPSRNVDVAYNVLDCRKIAADLGWEARVPLEQSIANVWQAMQTP